jgi:hypothetical protein
MADVSPEIAELLYRRLKRTQKVLGTARFELGTLLEVFRTNGALWRGRAESFYAFLEEERIQADGAKQFMRVAKKFVLDLKLDETTLDELACVNFRILDLAARIITRENQEEVLALVLALGERDAKVALSELTGANVEPEQRMARDVRSLMRRFRELPDDYRSAFMEQLNGRRRSDAQRQQVVC